MKPPALFIQEKRDGHPHSKEDIFDFINGLSSGQVTDYQATAWLMAVFLNGMTETEISNLTMAMLGSGSAYTFDKSFGKTADKHSTGGVGDKISLILGPLAAACGLKIPMMSGRGLGHSGGTLDKLESIQGFNVSLSESDFRKALLRVGIGMIGQSKDMVPADKKLYALRDVTATVECIPLIAASILSKKKAEGTESLVLDVKCGNGAFMKNLKNAKLLAKTLVKTGKKTGLKIEAWITDMNQPLGYAAGNSLEMIESIEILSGQKNLLGFKEPTPFQDTVDLTLHLTVRMLVLSGLFKNEKDAVQKAKQKLADGSAWSIFKKMVAFQGGQTDSPFGFKLAVSQKRQAVISKQSGFIHSFDTEGLGRLIIDLGGGRKKASDTIDPSVGIVFHHKIGSIVAKNERIATLFLPESGTTDQNQWADKCLKMIKIARSKPKIPRLIISSFD